MAVIVYCFLNDGVLSKMFTDLEKQLNYHFQKKEHLELALTHKSYSNEHLLKLLPIQNNERYEFLGDAILDAIISNYLLQHYPDAQEGVLSKMRATLVNEKTLAMIAIQIGLDVHIKLGKGEQQNGGNTKHSILSGVFEAVIAAIYLDGGFATIQTVVENIFKPFMEEMEFVNIFDYKSQLQELVQSFYKATPEYAVIHKSGPDHAKFFEVQVAVNGKIIGNGSGHSKKEAEQNAAKHAIECVR